MQRDALRMFMILAYAFVAVTAGLVLMLLYLAWENRQQAKTPKP